MRKLNYSKVFFGETRLKDIAVGASAWEIFKYRVAILTRRILMGLFASGMLYGAFFTGRVTTSPVFVNAEDKSQIMFENKIEKLKNEVLDTLSKCESAGHTEDDGIIILDTNNKASIGQFQWQISSVKFYNKQKTGIELTSKEAILLALDEDRARNLAKYVAFETKNKLSKDWYNCSVKYGLDEKVEMIKSLEK